ncbi:MAG: hypothetical protein IAE90_11670 [Ignavibacteria bacterium]|nr:hypothetical protein [Ignavibacteria bacterium]
MANTQNPGKNPGNNQGNDRSQEVDLPVPEKKNDDITTGNQPVKPEKSPETGDGESIEYDEEEQIKKENTQRTGFDPEKGSKNDDQKRGNESDRLERDTTDPKTKDAEWAKDKLNEGFNDDETADDDKNKEGNLQNTRAGKLDEGKEKERATQGSSRNEYDQTNDKRKDSILDKPKTETYGTGKDKTGQNIRQDNYTHTAEEEKRDSNNRMNKEKQQRV